jgi:hypothetical protein
VWARCEFTGEEGFKPVVRLFRNAADRLVHLSYRRDPGSARRGATGSKGGDADDGDDPATITGTDEHPFWSLTRDGWVAMGELKPGERLLLADGEATVTAIRIEHLDTPVTVYNFEVADWHTYHVGSQAAGWVFVHNACRVTEGSIAPHGRQPRPRRPLESHHVVQDAWAKQNVSGYNGNQAPTILLHENRHRVVNTRQNARRDARVRSGKGKWSTAIRDEFENSSRDLRAAGVREAQRKRALKKAYKYFDSLGAF